MMRYWKCLEHCEWIYSSTLWRINSYDHFFLTFIFLHDTNEVGDITLNWILLINGFSYDEFALNKSKC